MDEGILINYLRKQCNEEESRLIEQWCEESPENKKLLEDIYYTLVVGDISEVMNMTDTEQALRDFKLIIEKQKTKDTPKRSLFKWTRIASVVAAFIAGLLVMGGITLVRQLNQSKTAYTIMTEAGQRAQTELPDGSKVWLNSSTTITYKTSFWGDEREVNLLGEAYFEIAHNKKSRFVVNSKDIKTSVLGTKFNIRARDNEDRVVATLFEGSICINSEQNSKEEYILKPGQTIDIITDPYQVTLTEYEQPDDVLLWMDGRLTFRQHSLLEITDIFEKLYDVQFIYEDESIKNERFTGSFPTDNTPEEMLRILKLTNHLNFRKEGKYIYLYK